MTSDNIYADNQSEFGEWGLPPDENNEGTGGECSNLTLFKWSIQGNSVYFLEIIAFKKRASKH